METPSTKRYLEERIVFCANCDANRRLRAAQHGLVCVTCASGNWMYLPSGIQARLQAGARATVEEIKQVGQALVAGAAALSNTALRVLSQSALPVLTPQPVKVASNSTLPVIPRSRPR